MNDGTSGEIAEDGDSFAYGSCRVDGTGCPALQAGYDTMETKPWMLNPDRHRFLGIYDKVVRNMVGSSKGIIAANTCEEAWLAAIERVEENDWEGKEEMLTFARKVQKRFDWGTEQQATPTETATAGQ